MALGLLAERCCSRSWRSATSACAGPCSRSPASSRPSRAWRCSRCSIRCCSPSPRSPKQCFGIGFSALGFLPSLLALTLYSMLPIVRNGVAGMLNLDPAIVEAARGVGMTDWQRLWRVELPLAMPLLMAGVRTAAVWVIGAATLSTPVGQISLGNYIFSGLQVQDWVSVLFGCVAAAGLALVVGPIAGADRIGRRAPQPWRIAAGAVVLAGRHRSSRAAGAVSADRELRRRREEFHRAVHPLGAHGGADRRGGRRRRDGAPGLGSAIVFSALAAARSTCTSTTAARSGQMSCGARTTPGARRCSQRFATWLAREHGIACWARWDSRTRTRSRCAAIARSGSALQRSPISLRTRELAHRRRLRVLRATRVGGTARALRSRLRRPDANSSRRSCIKPSSTGKSTSSRPLQPTGVSPRTICCARRSGRRDPALRCDRPDRAQ